ncbi:hypothetical protein FACS189481_4710 [Clostridia bacterium]|nr:hypothetical protein FACS189481_4710 [Clostridia bacterium]
MKKKQGFQKVLCIALAAASILSTTTHISNVAYARTAQHKKTSARKNAKHVGSQNIKRKFSKKELEILSKKLYLDMQYILEQEKQRRGSLKGLNASNVLEILHAHNHFDNLPTVVKHSKFKKLAQKKTVLYRGIFADNQGELDKWIKQLKYGDCFYGSESAIFSTSSLAGAKAYAVPCSPDHNKNGTGRVVNFLLKNDAKIISQDALWQFIENYKKDHPDVCNGAAGLDDGFEKDFMKLFEGYLPLQRSMTTELLGFDAVCSENPKETEEEARKCQKTHSYKVHDENEFHGEQYVIQNRSMMVIDEKDTELEF